jgi:hypothetical protein
VLSMIGAVANGIPWLGHEVNQSGRAALILGEGGFDLGSDSVVGFMVTRAPPMIGCCSLLKRVST